MWKITAKSVSISQLENSLLTRVSNLLVLVCILLTPKDFFTESEDHWSLANLFLRSNWRDKIYKSSLTQLIFHTLHKSVWIIFKHNMLFWWDNFNQCRDIFDDNEFENKRNTICSLSLSNVIFYLFFLRRTVIKIFCKKIPIHRQIPIVLFIILQIRLLRNCHILWQLLLLLLLLLLRAVQERTSQMLVKGDKGRFYSMITSIVVKRVQGKLSLTSPKQKRGRRLFKCWVC